MRSFSSYRILSGKRIFFKTKNIRTSLLIKKNIFEHKSIFLRHKRIFKKTKRIFYKHKRLLQKAYCHNPTHVLCLVSYIMIFKQIIIKGVIMQNIQFNIVSSSFQQIENSNIKSRRHCI